MAGDRRAAFELHDAAQGSEGGVGYVAAAVGLGCDHVERSPAAAEQGSYGCSASSCRLKNVRRDELGRVALSQVATRAEAGGPAPASSLSDEIAKLDALHRGGALTLEEFHEAKARLLGKA